MSFIGFGICKSEAFAFSKPFDVQSLCHEPSFPAQRTVDTAYGAQATPRARSELCYKQTWED
jgi:hypothetical protein